MCLLERNGRTLSLFALNGKVRETFLPVLAKEIGYNMVDLRGILKRDISVLSRLASIGETHAGGKALHSIRESLNA
jgi:hypothetical protein